MNIRDFLLNKVLFPKVVVIDKPGIIISKTTRKYGRQTSKKRLVWMFEDIICNLQSETLKLAGRKATDELFYEIGKDMGTRHLLLAKSNAPPKPMLPFIINYLFQVASASGFSVTQEIDYNHKKQEIILKGSNNIICRKSRVPEFSAGMVSAFFSFLQKRNIEAASQCINCPDSCKIISNTDLPKRYIPKKESLRPLKEYYRLNFPEKSRCVYNKSAFSDLIKFKKIIVSKNGKFYFKKFAIFPSEVGFSGIIYEHFKNKDKLKILEKSVIESAEIIAKDIFGKKKKNERLRFFCTIFCALGFGLPSVKHMTNSIILELSDGPHSRFGFEFDAYILNGFINKVFNKRYRLTSVKYHKSRKITLVYNNS